MGRRSTRVTTWVERAALGAIMTVVAVVAERRLLKALRRRGEVPRADVVRSNDAELSAAPQDVGQ